MAGSNRSISPPRGRQLHLVVPNRTTRGESSRRPSSMPSLNRRPQRPSPASGQNSTPPRHGTPTEDSDLEVQVHDSSGEPSDAPNSEQSVPSVRPLARRFSTSALADSSHSSDKGPRLTKKLEGGGDPAFYKDFLVSGFIGLDWRQDDAQPSSLRGKGKQPAVAPENLPDPLSALDPLDDVNHPLHIPKWRDESPGPGELFSEIPPELWSVSSNDAIEPGPSNAPGKRPNFAVDGAGGTRQDDNPLISDINAFLRVPRREIGAQRDIPGITRPWYSSRPNSRPPAFSRAPTDYGGSALDEWGGIGTEGGGGNGDAVSVISRSHGLGHDLEMGSVDSMESIVVKTQAGLDNQSEDDLARICYVANLDRGGWQMALGVFGEANAKGVAALIHTGLTKYGASLISEMVCARMGWTNPQHIAAVKMIIAALCIGSTHHVMETGGKNFFAPFFGGRVLPIVANRAIDAADDPEAAESMAKLLKAISPGQAVPDSLHWLSFCFSAFLRSATTTDWVLTAMQSYLGGFLIASLLGIHALNQKVVTRTLVKLDQTDAEGRPLDVETSCPDPANNPAGRYLVTPTHATQTMLGPNGAIVSPFKSHSAKEFLPGFFSRNEWEGTGRRFGDFAGSLTEYAVQSSVNGFKASAVHKPVDSDLPLEERADELHRGPANQTFHGIATRMAAAGSGVGFSELIQTLIVSSSLVTFGKHELKGPVITGPYLALLTGILATHGKRNPHEISTLKAIEDMNPFRKGLVAPTRLFWDSLGVHPERWGKAGQVWLAAEYVHAGLHAVVRGGGTLHTQVAFDTAHETVYAMTSTGRKRQVSRLAKTYRLSADHLQEAKHKFAQRLMFTNDF